MEHIIPLAKKGLTEETNLAYSCFGCNNLKGVLTESIDPISGHIAPLFHPRKHQWNEHFAWNEDFTFIIGKSEIGRATLIALKLNRKSVVNLRKVLAQAGFHPKA